MGRFRAFANIDWEAPFLGNRPVLKESHGIATRTASYILGRPPRSPSLLHQQTDQLFLQVILSL